MTTVYVNGNECHLHETVGWLNYDRVVRLANLPPRDDYQILYILDDGRDNVQELGSGVMPIEGMGFDVAIDRSRRRPWWRWLWPE